MFYELLGGYVLLGLAWSLMSLWRMMNIMVAVYHGNSYVLNTRTEADAEDFIIRTQSLHASMHRIEKIISRFGMALILFVVLVVIAAIRGIFWPRGLWGMINSKIRVEVPAQ